MPTLAIAMLLMGQTRADGFPGIRCAQTGKRVNVSRAQWTIVRDALHSHDPKRIAPFISERGVVETAVTGAGVISHLVGKKEFLAGLTKITFHEKTANTGNGEDVVFIYAWFGLTPYGLEGERHTRLATARHTRSDVWISRSDGPTGRFRFVCEDGWLKIAEIKASLPPDP